MPSPDEQIFRKSASRLKTERASHERAVIRERALQLAPIFQSEGLEGVARHLALAEEDKFLLEIIIENEGLDGVALSCLRGEFTPSSQAQADAARLDKKAGRQVSTLRQPPSASRGASSTSPTPSPLVGGLPMAGQGGAGVHSPLYKVLEVPSVFVYLEEEEGAAPSDEHEGDDAGLEGKFEDCLGEEGVFPPGEFEDNEGGHEGEFEYCSGEEGARPFDEYEGDGGDLE